MRAEKCPVGYFSAGDTAAGSPTRNPACEKCPPGQSTSAEGDTLCDGEAAICIVLNAAIFGIVSALVLCLSPVVL
jgi:hypothetical protein